MDSKDVPLLATLFVIPFAGLAAIGMAYDTLIISLVGGVVFAGYTAWCAAAALNGFYTEVWPQMKRDMAGLARRDGYGD